MLDAAPLGEWAGIFVAVAAACTIIGKMITSNLVKDLHALESTLSMKIEALKSENIEQDHKLRNQSARTDALAQLRTSDREEAVKLQGVVGNLSQAVERVERGQDKLIATVNDRFDRLDGRPLPPRT